MLLSLLETILVMHLMAKDAVTPDEDNGDQTQNMNCGTQGRFCFLDCRKGESRSQKWFYSSEAPIAAAAGLWGYYCSKTICKCVEEICVHVLRFKGVQVAFGLFPFV